MLTRENNTLNVDKKLSILFFLCFYELQLRKSAYLPRFLSPLTIMRLYFCVYFDTYTIDMPE